MKNLILLIFLFLGGVSYSQYYYNNNYAERSRQELETARKLSEFADKQREYKRLEQERSSKAIEIIYKQREQVRSRIRESIYVLSESDYKEIVENEKNSWALYEVLSNFKNNPIEAYTKYNQYLYDYKTRVYDQLVEKLKKYK